MQIFVSCFFLSIVSLVIAVLFFSKRLLDFVESEAELSGSDIEEDDEDDGVSEDSYEVDEGSDIQLSDNELRNQVNKVHM